MKLFFSVLIMLFLCASLLISIVPVTGNENNPADNTITASVFNNSIISADRDVVSFYIEPQKNMQANLSLIMYHEAWIINNYQEPRTITILNPAPPDNNYSMSKYPIFGKMAIMRQSSIPNYFNPVNVTVLDVPEVQRDATGKKYVWWNITVNPHSAVIGAYADYYESGNEIFLNDSIILPSVKITRDYSNEKTSFIMNYSVTNTGALPLQNLHFVLFFPTNADNVRLVKLSDIIANSSCNSDILENTVYNDGSGRLSSGSMISSYCPEFLEPEEHLNFSFRINGDLENTGTIFPSLIVSYKVNHDLYSLSGLEDRIWPQTELVSSSEMNLTRFYYYETSVSIPENQKFLIGKTANGFRIYSNEENMHIDRSTSWETAAGTLSPNEKNASPTHSQPAPVPIALAFLAIGITFVAMGILRKK